MNTDDRQQSELVRDRFTRTAQVFGDFAVKERVREAELLARLTRAGSGDCAIDLACGPGTLALRFARHVRWIAAVDFTPAILGRARASAEKEDIRNLAVVLGDARQLPFADASINVAVTSYSLHHILDPQRVIDEMARVLVKGGRAGVLEMIVPEDAAAADLRNRIEVARDPSHARAMPASELAAMLRASGLRVTVSQEDSKARSFDHWLSVAGWKRGDAAYEETRALLEKSIRDGKDSGFYPKLLPPESPESPDARGSDARASDARGDIELRQSSVFVVGEKP
ncbi:MAG TPA: methyltransferase domain-containing protein [Candidatus Acidoferrales bacterium]|nr:methyltransferase domain-containing protein [Candidatus Acidoferrales bacterium]